MPKKELTFEQALEELQTVVERLEAGNAPLSESLAMYERGMELVGLCHKQLDLAEQRISAVKIGPEGVVTEPFVAEGSV